MSGWGRETIVTRYVDPNTSVINNRPADIPAILAKVLPGVVSISATSSMSSPFFGPGGGSTTVTAIGTGVVVTAGGEVVTNDHVVHGARSITVTLNNVAAPLAARIVGESAQKDLALLQVEGAPHVHPVTFGDSSKMVVGDDVLAVGYALGLSGGPTVTDGIISAKGRQVTTQTGTGATVTLLDMMQTDAAISSGNSGGPLVNSAAQVVGINTVVAASSRSTTAQNIGFAITSQTVQTLLPQLRTS
jgi:putative serine protease PepD